MYARASGNGTLTNEIQVNYSGAQEKAYVVNKVKPSNIKVTLKNSISSEETLEVGNNYMYQIIIENTSETPISDLKLELITSDFIQITSLICYSDVTDYIEPNVIEKQLTLNLEPKETKEIQVLVEAQKGGIAETYAKLTDTQNGVTLRSNKFVNEFKEIALEMNLNSENAGENVSPEDEINYTLTVKNDAQDIDVYPLEVEDTISDCLDITSVYVDDVEYKKYDYNASLASEEQSEDQVMENAGNYYYLTVGENAKNILTIYSDIDAGASKTIKINTKVKTDILDYIDNDTIIANSSLVRVKDEVQATSNEIEHILNVPKEQIPEIDENYDARDEGSLKEEPKEDETNTSGGTSNTQGKPSTSEGNTNNQGETPSTSGENTNNQEEKPSTSGENVNNQEEKPNTSGENVNNQGENSNTQGGDVNNQGTTQKPKASTYNISGTIWRDENKNGSKENTETKISDVKAELINAETASKVQEVTTNNSGSYKFENVEQGKYIIAFNYNAEIYLPTAYQADGVESGKNSDAITSQITIDGNSKTVAITDTLDVKENKTNIDLGLTDALKYDLNLTKTISKVTVINKAGTETQEYNDANLVKTDIHAKNINESTIIVEYTISVKNEGELAGYVKSIVDYKPTDLTFDSSLNSGWYQSGDNLYSTSLANTKIEPGETKKLTLILSKTMTESNIGLVNNLAEIAEDYNSLGIADVDSTSGNKQNSEDDLGSADFIVSIKTGAAISYISLVISLLGVLITGAYFVNRKISKAHKKI